MHNHFPNLESEKYLGNFRFISKEHCQGEAVTQENNYMQGVALTELTNYSSKAETNLHTLSTAFFPAGDFHLRV